MSCFDYKLSRRTWLGAAGATLLGMQVKQLVARAGSDHKPTAENVILFWNGGGMSHLETWDPKPGRPTGGEYSAIETSAPGVQISELFPELAKQMHHCSLVRSIAGTNGDHGRATYQLQTSYNASSNLLHPGLGSIVVHERQQQGDLPSYITLSGQAPRAGYLGQKCEAYFVAEPGEQDPYLAFPTGIAEVRGNQRLDVLARFNDRFTKTNQNTSLDATQTSIKDAVRLMRSPALEAFDLSSVPTTSLNKYGDTSFGRGCILAKRLVEKGVRFVQINRGGFDTHTDNFPAMEGHAQVMDPAMASLIEELHETGLLSKTLVIMLSEFGRTPKINEDAGRDHWPAVFSCFMAGGGIKGGQVIGSSDEDGYQPKDNPVEVPDLHATVCHALGINPLKEVMTQLQRPMKLIDGGKPIEGLLV